MAKENGKYIDGVIDGFLAVKPSGTIASLLPWPKKWISCDLIDGLIHIYNKEADTECIAVIHLPGSEYAVDAKEPLQFNLSVKHPQPDQHHFRAENNEDYTLWIDTVRACGASSRTARRTLSSTTSSRSSLISRCSSTETDFHTNGDEIDSITRRLQSLEESVYCPDETDSSDNDKTRRSLSSLQLEVANLKSALDSLSTERKEHRSKERLLGNGSKERIVDGNRSELINLSSREANDSISEHALKYKHSLEIAQQMCINARQWETRYLRLSLQYLKLQTFLQHLESGFTQQSAIPEYLDLNHVAVVKTIAEFTDCHDPVFESAGKSASFVDSLGFRTQFDTTGLMMRYMCQERLRDNIMCKLEPTDTLTIRWQQLLEKSGDSIKRSKESKELVRLGIPSKLRAKLWKSFIVHRCSKLMKSKGPKYYQSLVQSPELSPSDKQISLDLHRSFPRNVYFNSDNGTKVPVLQRVLVAFSLHNRAIGYCQGMNMIAGMLLFLLDEESAFWGLVAILEMIMPSGYYNTDLLAARADQIIFQELVENKMPCLAAYLKHHDIDFSLFSFNWFMTIFIDSLPMNTVIRLWDLFLLEGHKTLLRCSLALVKLHEFSLMQHHDSVSIFNMFRRTSRSFYDSELVIKLAYGEFKPFPKRGLLYKRHSEKLADLRCQHAENERQWRERQHLPDTVDRDTWDIVPATDTSYTEHVGSTCLLHVCAARSGSTLYAVQSQEREGVRLLKISLCGSGAHVLERSEHIEHKVTCCVHVQPGIVLLGTSNGYVLSYHSDTLTRLASTWVMDCVLGVALYRSQILVHLTNGSLVKFEGISESGLYAPSILDIGTCPVRAGLVVRGVSRGTGSSSEGALVDELWCSSGNTVYFVDLGRWCVLDKLCVCPQSTTQIGGMVAYSSTVLFVSVCTTIAVWDVHRKMCLSSHDCSVVFLPPPSPKSKSYQGIRMSIRSLYYDSSTASFWVGTSHGHVLIYEVGALPVTEERGVERGGGDTTQRVNPGRVCRDNDYTESDYAVKDCEDAVFPGQVESDDETSIRVLNDLHLYSTSPPQHLHFTSPPEQLGPGSRDLHLSRDQEDGEEDIAVLTESLVPSEPETGSPGTMETSLVVIPTLPNGEPPLLRTLANTQSPLLRPLIGDDPSVLRSLTSDDPAILRSFTENTVPESGGCVYKSESSHRSTELAPTDPLSSPRGPLCSSPSVVGKVTSSSSGSGKFSSQRRIRNNTYNEYDVMEDHCDLLVTTVEAGNGRLPGIADNGRLPGIADKDMSPVHVYHTFNRYTSQEDLAESDKEGEYELISDQKTTNILTLNTYQILSGDPIAAIEPLSLQGCRYGVMTCGGGVDQEGVIVMWNALHDPDKIRWQAEPVSVSSTCDDVT